MATALQQQLAVIAANSTHQLDLKAQKSRHSKSLLFEPRDAASQSFDTIYQICIEGFDELCALDARFSVYARNLFSEQSKSEDRTQMTSRENEELNKTVESFMGLLSGRLLLKPAMKAMEWLVRRFRVQEYTTETVLLAFLPYHSSHIFSTLLSILPDRLPPSFKFLQPYAASFQSPPRHAVLTAAIGNPSFFSAFSHFVLRTAKARHHSAILVGFWASITAQAVNGMIDSTRSGRVPVRKQREEDLLLRVLPILQSAFSIQGVPELYLASCMIMTIIATKASLEDRVLDAMMETVATAWTPSTVEDGLVCLAVLAEEKEQAALPQAVVQALVGLDGLLPMLQGLSKRQRTDRLLIGLVVGISQDTTFAQNHSPFVKSIISGDLVSPARLPILFDGLLVQYQSAGTDSIGYVTALLEGSTRSEVHKVLLQQALKRRGLQLPEDGALLQLTDRSESLALREGRVESSSEMNLDHAEDSAMVLDELPGIPDTHPSFLDQENSSLYREYVTAFENAILAGQNVRQILDAKNLRRSHAASVPTFLSFLTRVWCSSAQPLVRLRTLEAAVLELQGWAEAKGIDMQFLLPYAIGALQDESQAVRQTAAKLCRTIKKMCGSKDDAEDVEVWCRAVIYGEQSVTIKVLPTADVRKLLGIGVLPMLEDCVLDGKHAAPALADTLKGSDDGVSASSEKTKKTLKASLRSEICDWFAQVTVATPVIRAKQELLEVLSRAGKAAAEARKNILLPFIERWTKLSSEERYTLCEAEGLKAQEVDKAIISSLSHRSAEEIEALKRIAASGLGASHNLGALAYDRLRHLWPSMKTAPQIALVDWLLDTIVAETDTEGEALDMLRSLQCSADVLLHTLETLPNAYDLQDQPPSAKKQRIGKGENSQTRKPDPEKLNAALKRITTVLELIEGAKPEQHPELLKGLFHLLGELHHYKTMLGSQLVYIQASLMGCLLSVIQGVTTSRSLSDVDRTVIRADLIVETVRTTSSTQVHNTALLLISRLASWAPELVLHNVMPLFTFMSTTLLRQGDEFTAHVTDQTVSRIVPPLAASLKKRGKDLIRGTSELLLSFTAAFEHIPLHRRDGLFRHLVQTLGPDEALYAVSAMLIDRYPTDERVLPFVCDLMAHFPVVTELRSLKQCLNVVFDALKPKRAVADVVLSLVEKDDEQVQRSIQVLLQALAEILEDDGLRKRVAKGFASGKEGAKELQQEYAQLLDRTMQLARDLSTNDNLRDATTSVLNSLLGLTPTKDFIESSAQLMQAGSNETRQQVFRALEARVAQAKRGDAELQRTFLEVLPNCSYFISSNLPVAVCHAAITCIDQIVEKYGKLDRAAVLETAKVVAGDAALGSEDTSLRIISILCLASMVEVLGDDIIGLLPSVQRKAIEYQVKTQNGTKLNHQLQNAVFSFFDAVLDHLPWMFSDLEIALELAGRAVTHPQRHDGDAAAADQFCSIVAQKIKPDVLFSAVDNQFDKVAGLGAPAAAQLLETVQKALRLQSKKTLQPVLQPLSSILLKAFDLRRTTHELNSDVEKYDEVFLLADRVAMDLTLKMDNTHFRPFFARFVEWATNGLPKSDATGRILRLTSFYSFAHAFFNQLGSLVTSYASFLLESAASILTNLHLHEPMELVLLEVLLQALSSNFRHDQDDFWQAPSHFDAIAPPILSLLGDATVINITDRVIPTIADLAAAAASPDHHKTMNSQIMRYMRNNDAMVRLAAVKCERAITERLGLDWLALLPEMLPFISELQEDDDEHVERETLRWVRQIEEVTGESLEGMLQ